MSKRKYKQGKPITSLDEFFEHDWFMVGGHGFSYLKTYHAGWCRSWQLQIAKRYIDAGAVYVAEPIENNN